MKAIGFNLGLRGDIIMNSVASRAFKEVAPEYKLTLGVGPQFSDMLELYKNHPYIDDVHSYSSYDGWPSKEDIEYLKNTKYDFIFNGMPHHTSEKWWKLYHQTEETCRMHGLPVPQNLQCELNPWFKDSLPNLKDYIAFNYIGGFYAGYPNNKSYSPERAREIVKLIRDKGYKVIVLGDPKEPELKDTERKPLTYIESIKTMLACKAFIGIDSGLTWASSAYSFPTLACYSNEYYGEKYVKNIQPINPKAQYLDAKNLNDIDLGKIEEKINNLI